MIQFVENSRTEYFSLRTLIFYNVMSLLINRRKRSMAFQKFRKFHQVRQRNRRSDSSSSYVYPMTNLGIAIVAGMTVSYSVWLIVNFSLLAKPGSYEEEDKLKQIKKHSHALTEGGTNGINRALSNTDSESGPSNKNNSTRTSYGYFGSASKIKDEDSPEA